MLLQRRGPIPLQTDIAAATPFLVLDHPFARRVLEVLRRRARFVPQLQLAKSMFRGRTNPAASLPSEFEMPPPRLVAEGRYNHAGRPALYLASSAETCLYELRQPGGPAFVAEIRVIRPLRVLDLNTAEEGDDDDSRVLAAVTFSSLLSAPANDEGWAKPEYVFSRFVADCATAAGFDALLYPSTRVESGHNLVVLRPVRFADLAVVERVVFNEGTRNIVVWPGPASLPGGSPT
jgi:RES domain-containing protein